MSSSNKGSACSKVLQSFLAGAAAQTAWMTIAPLAVESEPSLARSLKLVFPVGLLSSDKRRYAARARLHPLLSRLPDRRGHLSAAAERRVSGRKTNSQFPT